MKKLNFKKKLLIIFICFFILIIFKEIYQNMEFYDVSFMNDNEIRFNRRLDEIKDRSIASIKIPKKEENQKVAEKSLIELKKKIARDNSKEDKKREKEDKEREEKDKKREKEDREREEKQKKEDEISERHTFNDHDEVFAAQNLLLRSRMNKDGIVSINASRIKENEDNSDDRNDDNFDDKENIDDEGFLF